MGGWRVAAEGGETVPIRQNGDSWQRKWETGRFSGRSDWFFSSLAATSQVHQITAEISENREGDGVMG